MTPTPIAQNVPVNPGALRRQFGGDVPARTFPLYVLEILQQEPRAFYCPVKCPCNIILRPYDLAMAREPAFANKKPKNEQTSQQNT